MKQRTFASVYIFIFLTAFLSTGTALGETASTTELKDNTSVSDTSDTDTASTEQETETTSVATVKGYILDGNKNPLPKGSVGIVFQDPDGFVYSAAVDSAGYFLRDLEPNSYKPYIHVSSDLNYTVPDLQEITLASGETKDFGEILLSLSSSKITGHIKDSSGNILTGLPIRIGATTGNGIWKEGVYNSSTGSYTLTLSAGTWYLNYYIDPSSGYLSKEAPESIFMKENETHNRDITLSKAGASIKGRLAYPSGEGISGAFVAASSQSFSGIDLTAEVQQDVIGSPTDVNGNYQIDLPAGSYYLKAFILPEINFTAPMEKEVSIGEGEVKTIGLELRTPSIKMFGTVFAENAPVAEAFVWAWSDTGAYKETKTNSDGVFELSIHGSDTWHVAAAKDINSAFYRSTEQEVFVGEDNVGQVIYLEKKASLPAPVVKVHDVSQTTVVEIPEGAKVTMPVNVTTTASQLNVEIKPDTESPSQGSSKVVGVAYNIEAKNDSGQLVSNFDNSVTVSMPYKEAELIELNAKEDNLALHFWDTASGTWKKLNNSTVNKADNLVTATTSHFTRFAILTVVAAVDVSHVVDGDLIKTANDPDVYIAKKIGGKKFKRLILNPDIFNSYGHLSWDNIKIVNQAELDEFVLSGLTIEIYADGTPVNGQVYQVSSAPGSDVGVSSRVQMTPQAFESAGYDWDGIFKINHIEASPDFYPEGSPITA